MVTKNPTPLDCLIHNSLVTLVAVRMSPAQVVVVTLDINLDLMVERTAAGIVDLLEDIPSAVLFVLAVAHIRRKVVDNTRLDAKPFEEGLGMVPRAAEAKGLLGAVLWGFGSVKRQAPKLGEGNMVTNLAG